MAEALQVPDDELVAALSSVLNVERYITFWALETIVNHADGYAFDHNNFYVYFDPADDDRAVFIPWGVDKTMIEMSLWGVVLGSYLNAHLPRRLSRIPTVAAAMEDELRRLATEVWDEDAILASIDTYEAHLENAGSNNPAAVQSLRAWVSGQAGSNSRYARLRPADGRL